MLVAFGSQLAEPTCGAASSGCLAWHVGGPLAHVHELWPFPPHYALEMIASMQVRDDDVAINLIALKEANHATAGTNVLQHFLGSESEDQDEPLEGALEEGANDDFDQDLYVHHR